MPDIVVDTNVPVVANGKSGQASPTCVATCAKRLVRFEAGDERLIIDSGWLIIREYKNNLSQTGQPGPGSSFLKWVLTNYANPQRCKQVAITPSLTIANSFDEFPNDPALSGFDPSDRKFVAVALAHAGCPPILQAVDRKWWNLRDDLERNGVSVEFICENDVKLIANQ